MTDASADGSRLLAGIQWDRGKPESVSGEIIRLLIAASLVESRGDLYGDYLARVFSDDPEFVQSIRRWSTEENEHGIALSTWLTRSIPKFEFQTLLKRYNNEIKLAYQDSSENRSIRGSKVGELLSRCAVESSTSTYYKSVANVADDEPLKIICSRLAQDEISHYSLFRKKLDRLRCTEKLGPLKLLLLSVRRLLELEDDQMSYAYYIACDTRAPYSRSYCSSALMRTALGLYTKERIAELIKLNVRAFGASKSHIFSIIAYDTFISAAAACLRFYMKSRVVVFDLKQTAVDLYQVIVLGRFFSRGY